MSKAVKFDEYGGTDVLKVVEVERPAPGRGEVLVRVKAAGINPGEAYIRKGDMGPTTFPSGEGSDLAGVVEEIGPGVDGIAVGDEVIAFSNDRGAHAELALVPASQVIAKPEGVSWEVGGGLYVAGTTAYAAVRAVGAGEGDTVVVAGAAGGVGSIAVQLARNAGATVIGLASERHHAWLTDHGVRPVTYGEGVADRIREASDGRVDAFIDTIGAGYVDLAIELGVAPERIDTILDFDTAAKVGAKAEGNAAAANAGVLAELAGMIAAGRLEVPIAGVYPLGQVQDAYRELERRHSQGKIVLTP